MADGTDQTQAGEEPSMEEILASIRKIIADDNAPEDAVASEEEPKTADDGTIDLTQMMQDDGSVVDLSAQPPHEIDLDDHDAVSPSTFSEPVPELPTESLVSEPAVEAAASSLANLTNTLEIERLASSPHRPTFIGNGSRTLEDMALELMRPMLKQWLDQNLPATVERLVQKEVERITRRAKD